MNVTDIAAAAGKEIAFVESSVDITQVNRLIGEIEEADRIFVCGAGRSLLMLRAFAMRLMHLGFESYVVGDTTTPAFGTNDLLIAGSGSGETSGIVLNAKKVKEIGGKIGVLTIFEDSTLANKADFTVRIPAYTNKLPKSEENRKSILPGGGMFEIGMLVLLDAMIVPLGEYKKVSTNKYFDRHANLE